MRKSKTAKALKENLKELTSTKSSVKKSKGSLTRKTQTKKGKTSTKITIVQSRKKDLFPMMNQDHTLCGVLEQQVQCIPSE